MQTADIKICLKASQPAPYSYKVAGLKMVNNAPINLLSAFKSHHQYLAPEAKQILEADFKPLYSGKGWLAGRNRQIFCNISAHGYQIKIPEVADFFVSHDGGYIRQLPQNPSANFELEDDRRDTLEQALIGPPLILALALKQRFMLHASAVKINGQAILFAGDSGQGKSTIASWLNEMDQIERLADDLCVLELKQDRLTLLADFPQLKLPAHQQHAITKPVNIKAVVLINRADAQEIELKNRQSLKATQVLLNHSVSAQLFDKALAKKHLQFMTQAQQHISIYQLNYPNGQQHSSAIKQILKKLTD